MALQAPGSLHSIDADSLNLRFVARLIEPALDGARNANAGVRHARAEDLDELVDVHLAARAPEVGEVGLLDLGGIAHGAHSAR
jgi:hypothetical protein